MYPEFFNTVAKDLQIAKRDVELMYADGATDDEVARELAFHAFMKDKNMESIRELRSWLAEYSE